MITTCTASTDRYLTTTGFVKILLGVTGTSADDQISAQILVASRWAESFVGRPLTVQTYQETMPGYGSRTIAVKYTPLVGIQRMFEGGTDTGTNSEILTSERRIDDAEAGFISRTNALGFQWTAGGVGPGQFGWGSAYSGPEASIPLSPFTPLPGQEDRSFLCEYTAGYSYNGVDPSSPNWTTNGGTTSTGRTLPEDIELAVALRVQQLREGSPSVYQENLGDMRVSYRTEAAADVYLDTQRPEGLLMPYRRIK